MVHTFEIYTNISKYQARHILDNLGLSKNQHRYLGPANVNGIARIGLWARGEEYGYVLKLVVNPAKLLYGFDAFETVSVDKLADLTTLFAGAIKIALDVDNLPDLPDWLVHRIDYAVDVRTEHLDRLLLLFDKGDRPRSYREKVSGKNGSCYWECRSTTANIYNKAKQMANEGKSPEVVERAKNILRFEVQCKSPKVGYLRKKNDLSGRELRHFFCHEFAKSVLLSYCQRVFKTGDYYSFRSAVKHMKQLGVSRRGQRAYGNVLRAIAQARSITQARRQLSGEGMTLKNTNPPLEFKYSPEQFGRNCRGLAAIKINPVTIPRDWGIDYIPGIFELLESVLYNCSENRSLIA